MVGRGFLKPDQPKDLVDRYQSMAKIAEVLMKRKIISDQELAKLFSVAYDVPFVHLAGRTIPQSVLTVIPEAVARKYSIVAYDRQGSTVKLAVAQPYHLSPAVSGPLHEQQSRLGVDFQLAITTKSDLAWALSSYSRVTLKYANQSDDSADSLPFVDLTDRVIPSSVLQRFPQEIAAKYHMVVFDAPAANELQVALVYPNDPSTDEILDYIEQKNHLLIKRFQTSTNSFEKALKGYGLDREPADRPATVGQPPADRLKESGPARQLFDVKYSDGIAVITEKSASSYVQELAAKTGQEDLEESNLDKVLKASIGNVGELVEVVTTGYIPRVVAAIIGYAVNQKASDIHLEPLADRLRLRFRIDGLLREIARLPLSLQPAIISRIKILSGMKIDEQRIPQDGRFDAQSQNHTVDLRVSSLPTIHGEKIVIRLLDKSAGLLTLEQLGLEGINFDRLTEAIKRPWGVIMATGPTGSGKSTTLYAILNRISSVKVNVITLEDPVEYDIPGINQTQVKPKIGFSFAEGLRSVLRQDPNVIMVGEVRDRETAELVTHAALTGHLVLTTLHTNDAPGALPRLINIGVEPFLITSAINVIIGQRLVRRLCQTCKKPADLPGPVVEKIKKELIDHQVDLKFWQPVGCSQCTEGYTGRIGIFEVMAISDPIELAALQRQPASQLAALATKEGMITMRQDGILKAAKGLTTVDEVMKATSA